MAQHTRCKNCGHPAGLHSTPICGYDFGSRRTERCQCDKWEEADLSASLRRAEAAEHRESRLTSVYWHAERIADAVDRRLAPSKVMLEGLAKAVAAFRAGASAVPVEPRGEPVPESLPGEHVECTCPADLGFNCPNCRPSGERATNEERSER